MHHERKRMYHYNLRFFAFVLCISTISVANAAPSVRVLGSSTGYTPSTGASSTKSTGVQKGTTTKSSVLNANNLGVKKAASVKTMSPSVATMQPVARASSGRIGTTGVAGIKTAASSGTTAAIPTGANRFPGIASKTNVQKTYNPVATGTITSTDPNAQGYNMQDMKDKLGNLEETMDVKADKSELENYYTKEEVNNEFYTSAQIDEKLSAIDTSASSSYITYLTDKVNSHTSQIETIIRDSDLIYDLNSGEKKSIYIVTDFDAGALFGTN